MAIKKEVTIEANTDDAIKEIKELFKTMVDAEKEAQKQSEKLNDSVAEIGETAKTTEKGVSAISKGFRGLGVAIKAAGIGLVISALGTLKEVFESNQKVADLFSTAFETVSLVFNQFANIVVDVVQSVNEATNGFDALGKVLSGLLTIAITPLKLSFFAIKLGIQEAQLVWENSFFGDKDQETIKELNKGIQETKQALADTGTEAVQAGKDIYNNFTEAVGEVGTLVTETVDGISQISITGAYESAKANVQLKNTAELAVAEQTRLVEQYDRQAEQLRQIRDNDLLSLAERTKANDELNTVLEEQEKAMLKQADLQIASAQAEADKNNSIENRKALIEAVSNREGVLAQIEGFRSEQQSNKIALDKEELDLINSKTESETQLANEQKRFLAEQQENEIIRLEMLRTALEEEKAIELERLQNKIDSYAEGTQYRIDAEIEYATKKQEIDQEIADNKKETSLAEEQLDKQVSSAKLGIAKQSMALIGEIAGEGSKVGKAMAIGQATISGIEGVQNAYTTAQKSPITTVFPAYPIIQASLAGVFSALQIRKIASTKADGKGSTQSPQVSGGSAPTTPSIPPAFNIVGSSGTNQLADAIGGQSQQPIRTYVVSSDVTTGQSLDRNIVEGATIG